MAVDSLTLLQRAIGSTVEPPDDPLSERILDAALEICAASGVKNLTMDEVADRADVGRMTVYRRFGSREHLEEALAVREARRCLAELDSTVDPGAPAADQIAQGMLTSLRLIREHPLLNRMSRVEPAAALAALTSEGAVFAMSRAFVAARIAESQREGKLDRGLDPEQAAEILVRIGFSFLLIPQSALPLDDDERMREVARELVAPILGGADE
ncbi:MAG TPA: TetR/AcrR family transcriptional regulator [Solirubrobacterales bacterium]